MIEILFIYHLNNAWRKRARYPTPHMQLLRQQRSRKLINKGRLMPTAAQAEHIPCIQSQGGNESNYFAKWKVLVFWMVI